MNKAKRTMTENKIIQLLEVRNRMSVEELCQACGMASSTMRKKLAKMEGEGLLIRTHGGALSIDSKRDDPIDKKIFLNVPQKKAIALAAISFIKKGDVVAVAGGSTTGWMSSYKHHFDHTIVYTDSITFATSLTQQENNKVEVHINGGIVRGRTGCIIGTDEEEVFNNVHFDKAFIGCEGFSLEKGAGSENILVGKVERAMALQATEIFILCDSTKLKKDTLYTVIEADRVTKLITDDEANPYYIDILRDHGIDVLVTSVKQPSGMLRDLGLDSPRQRKYPV